MGQTASVVSTYLVPVQLLDTGPSPGASEEGWATDQTDLTDEYGSEEFLRSVSIREIRMIRGPSVFPCRTLRTVAGTHHRVVIIGPGFAGVGMAIRLRQAGIDDFVVLERAGTVGGVWRDNVYPGCQCDVPSHLYSYSFAPKADWTRSYPLREEIWRYLEDCSDQFDVRRSIRFNTAVTSAHWDEDRRRWRIETPEGEWTADALVAGVGALSEPNLADIPGIESFDGPVFHSATWRHDVDLTGRTVAVIGTGSSAIQFVPRIQPLVKHLVVFQRTPPWVVPQMDVAIGPEWQRRYARHPWMQRVARLWQYWSRELTVSGWTRMSFLRHVARRMATKHLEKQVPDPELRRRLTPPYEIGCKRILLSDAWYPAIQQPNVELVESGVREIRPGAVVGADGVERDVDAIIFGTGFRVTTHPGFDHIVGRGGVNLGDLWREQGMEAYLGTTVAGFPNLFLMTGPNTGLGHSSIVFILESQFTYVLGALRALEARHVAAFDPKPDVQTAYNAEIQRRLEKSVWNSGGCSSWYLDARGRNPTLWPGSTVEFRLRLRKFDVEAYESLDRRPVSADSPVTVATAIGD